LTSKKLFLLSLFLSIVFWTVLFILLFKNYQYFKQILPLLGTIAYIGCIASVLILLILIYRKNNKIIVLSKTKEVRIALLFFLLISNFFLVVVISITYK